MNKARQQIRALELKLAEVRILRQDDAAHRRAAEDRAEAAERRERQLAAEHRNLRRRISELEAELQSRGLP